MTIASVGQSVDNVPAVVFFDELDSLAELLTSGAMAPSDFVRKGREISRYPY